MRESDAPDRRKKQTVDINEPVFVIELPVNFAKPATASILVKRPGPRMVWAYFSDSAAARAARLKRRSFSQSPS
ncbi:MAG: hypothetical protein ACYSOP_06570, partial [Planctomycetota bacterium]